MEEALRKQPKFRFIEKGNREGENVYMALSQTEDGRYLTTLFIYKPASEEQKKAEALILSARDMADKERKLYGKK